MVEDIAHALDEGVEAWSIREAPVIIVVADHPPVGRVEPDEIKLTEILVACRRCRILTLEEIKAHALDAKLLAYIAACTAARHRVKHPTGLEVQEHVPDEIPAAVASISGVPVRATLDTAMDAC